MDDLLLLLLLLLGERKKGVNPKRETGSLAQKTPSLLNPLFPLLSVNCKTEKAESVQRQSTAMERSLTVDIPVEQVAKVVKRHLVTQPSLPTIPQRKRQQQQQQQQRPSRRPETTTRTTLAQTSYSPHHRLPGGAIVDEIYKWTARVESDQKRRRQRAESVSFPVHRQPVTDPLLQSLKQPGGFRRYHVLSKASKPPNFVTSSFVEFLCLYGHFGGEDLSDDEEDSSSLSSSSSVTSSSEDEGPSTSTVHRGQMISRQSYGSMNSSSNNSQLDQRVLPPPVTASSKPYQPLQYHQLQTRETMPLMSRSRPGQILQGKATPGKAMFLLLKSFVTTGNNYICVLLISRLTITALL